MASTSPHSVAGPHTARVSAPTTAGQPGNLVGQRDDGRQDDRGGSPIRCGAGPPANERGAIHGVRCRWRSASRAASSAWRTSTTGSPTAASTSRAIRPHAGGRRLDGFDTGHGVSAHSGRRGMASELRAAGSVYDGRADGRRLARPADGRPLRLGVLPPVHPDPKGPPAGGRAPAEDAFVRPPRMPCTAPPGLGELHRGDRLRTGLRFMPSASSPSSGTAPPSWKAGSRATFVRSAAQCAVLARSPAGSP